MPTKWRIFLDTSALLAGLNSPTGAAGVILAACFAHEFMPVVSPQIIEEAERNIPVKFPLLKDGWASFLLIPPEVAPEPPLSEVRRARVLLPTSDAPILACAFRAKPDALITWNTRDFQRPNVRKETPFPILTPGEFIEGMWRAKRETGGER